MNELNKKTGKEMENVRKAVEKYTDLMAKAERHIWNNPEVGYKEFKTNAYMM